jgi:hypothetical protein
MAITRTINYTQNVPITLGFSNYLSNATTASVEFLFSNSSKAQMGYISTTATAGVSVVNKTFSTSTSSPYFTSTTLYGTMANLNTALNTALYQNHFYEADTTTQDFLSQNRTLPSDWRGEFQIQINPNIAHGLSVGSLCQLSSSLGYDYTVTKIDSSNSATRIWFIYANNYDLSTVNYNNAHSLVGISNDAAGNAPQTGTVTKTYNSYYLQTSTGTNIAPINDISYNNPHGDYSITMNIKDGSGTVLETGTISLSGTFFIAEPTFSSLPPTSISATSLDTVAICNFGQIAQTNSNYQSVQVLMKYAMNDPQYLNVSSYSLLNGYNGTLQFIGDAINAKASLDVPRYIIDESYGTFTTVNINNSVSVSPPTGIISWYFYGTPADCNYALTNVYYYRPPAMSKDFNVEIRIVNGRTRIYGSRGR